MQSQTSLTPQGDREGLLNNTSVDVQAKRITHTYGISPSIAAFLANVVFGEDRQCR